MFLHSSRSQQGHSTEVIQFLKIFFISGHRNRTHQTINSERQIQFVQLSQTLDTRTQYRAGILGNFYTNKSTYYIHNLTQTFDLPIEQITLEKPMDSSQLSPYDDRVFNVNKSTNVAVHLRRKKLKSVRKTNFEFLMRQVLADVLPPETVEYNESREIQEKMKILREKKRSKV